MAAVVIEAIDSFDVVWMIADILNGLMAISTLHSQIPSPLSPVILKITGDYKLSRSQAEESHSSVVR